MESLREEARGYRGAYLSRLPSSGAPRLPAWCSPGQANHGCSRAFCRALSTRLQSDYTHQRPALLTPNRTNPFINTKAN